VREDPVRAGLLFAATERSVWVSFNDGVTWQSLRKNLPLVPVHDLAIKEGDLIAATHGRSFWILDDLSALRQMNPTIAASKAHLFKPRDVYRADFSGGGGTGAAGGHPTGQNPPNGAVVYYWLKDKNQTVTLEFLDSKGTVVRKYTSLQDSGVRADSLRTDSIRRNREDSLRRAGVNPDSAKRSEARSEETPAEEGPRRAPPPPRVANKAGLNVFTWNLYYPEAVSFEGMIFWAGGTQGPMALPGKYSVRMTVNGDPAQTQTFSLVKDPRSKATQAELAEQFNFLLKIRDRVSEANNAVRTIRNLRSQLTARRKSLSDQQCAELDAASSAMMTHLSAIEAEIYQVKNQSSQDPLNYPIRLNNKIAALAGVVASTDARPTDQSYTVFNDLSAQLDKQLAAMKAEMSGLAAVNAKLKSWSQPEIVPGTGEIRSPSTTPARTEDTDEDDADGH
jgi:hypothetical protein